MNDQEFKRQKNKIWKEYEKGFGLISFNIRRLLENDIKATGKEDYLRELDRSIPDYLDDMASMFGNGHQAIKPTITPTNASGKERYPKPFEKRLYFVDFVAPLSFVTLITTRSLLGHNRINWKDKSAAWNKKHPSDPRTPVEMRKEFSRFIHQEDLMQEYFNRKTAELFSEFEAQKAELNKAFQEIKPQIIEAQKAITEVNKTLAQNMKILAWLNKNKKSS